MSSLTRFPWVLSGFAGCLWLSTAAAQADTLQSWRFDAQQNQLELITDQGVQPSAQLVANPTRLVIDLPGIRLGRPKINQSVGGAVQNVRIGQFDAQTTRVVVELAPGYTVDPQQVKIRGLTTNRWTVQLPTPRMDATASATIANPIPATPARPALFPNSTRPVMAPLSQPLATVAPPGDTFGGLIPAGRNLTWLQQRLATLKSSQYSSLGTGLYVLDLETGNYLDINGDRVYATASIIKLPILIALFQDVDAGKIDLNETLTMTRDVVVGGSGEMQDLPVGSKFSVLETANKMITISDNTATNMIIKRMGGIQYLNQRFRSWGLQKTGMRNWLPDLKGTNVTTPKELGKLLVMLNTQQMLSPRSQAQAIDILQRVRNRKLLVVGLGPGATIAHKTGDIGFLLGDAGIVQMPMGKRYVVVALVESAYDDPRARDFIQDVSRIVYTYLSNPTTASVEQAGGI